MAKRNNALMVRIGIWLAVIIFAAGGFYLLVNFRLDAVEGNVGEVEEDVEAIDKRVDFIDDAVLLIQYDLEYIKGDLAEQRELSKEILKELQK